MAPHPRRLASVDYAKKLISAIEVIRQQKQIPNFERISRQLQRQVDISPKKIKEHLNNAVEDDLIEEYTTTVNKGQNTGLEQEGYRLFWPQNRDGHDWYCFECHEPGEVYECDSCFRVYHQGCTPEITSNETFTCTVCRAGRKKNKLKKKMLNTLLSYTVLRLKEKTKDLHKISTKLNANDFRRYVYRKMDINKMEQKVLAFRYRCLEEFLADAKIILHNCILVFGADKNGMSGLAAIMVADCKYELDEIELCPNCYYMSNAKPEDWFSQPCFPPHEVVFAKQKGFSYWPAKVVRDLGAKYDVRFFGGYHQRAVIPAECIKPITKDFKSLDIKKTGGFLKAMKELTRYQDILREKERDGYFQSYIYEVENDDDNIEEDNYNDDEFDDDDVDDFDNEEFGEETIDNDDFSNADEEEEEIKEQSIKKIGRRKSISKKESLSNTEEEKGQLLKKTFKRRSSSFSRSRSKTSQKRRRHSTEEKNDSDNEKEDDFGNRQVSSTSADKSSKTSRRLSFKSISHDESTAVTSSVDKVSNIQPLATVAVSVQTALKTENMYTQTDIECPELEDNMEISHAIPPALPSQSDEMWEKRMASAMANLTKRLEDKFEEDKAIALKLQSQQLEEDFGKDKQQAVERTVATMKLEIEKARKQGEDKAREQYMEEMKKLAAKHKETISQTKKKQWCQFCEEEAMYHCCWNTSYCSVKCQQEHWHKEHKRICRRKRNESSK